ncbi:15957_t:CDS:2, partial [Rhizophagus irregularis]
AREPTRKELKPVIGSAQKAQTGIEEGVEGGKGLFIPLKKDSLSLSSSRHYPKLAYSGRFFAINQGYA